MYVGNTVRGNIHVYTKIKHLKPKQENGKME